MFHFCNFNSVRLGKCYRKTPKEADIQTLREREREEKEIKGLVVRAQKKGIERKMEKETIGMEKPSREVSGYPFFRIAISLTEDNNNLGWLKIDPPDFWRLDKDGYKKHSHNPDYRKNFSKKFVDLKVHGISFCKYPISCRSVSIGSTIYCVGRDKDIDADIRDVYSERIGPPITKRTSTTSFRPPVPRNNLSHKIGSRNFFSPLGEELDWKLDNASTLLSPRYCPAIVAVGGKIFLFAGNRFPVNELDYVPFAEVFNPETGLCSLISDPPFPNRIGYSFLFVAPFLGRDGQQKILVMSHARHGVIHPPPGTDAAALYDVKTDTWEPFHDPERKQLYLKTFDIIGTPIPVAQQDSIYWFRNRYKTKPPLLCSYNWKTKHFWEGSLFGLQHESPIHRFNHSAKTLLHIDQDLFCLVWDDILDPPTSDNEDFTHVHFTFLRVSREDPPSSSLSAFVVGCFSHILPVLCDVQEAYLLR